MKKKILTITNLFVFTSLGLGLLACGNTNTSSSTSSASSSAHSSESISSSEVLSFDYQVTITAIGSTTISVSKTLQLRSNVTGTKEKNVIWSSADDKIATVSDRGLVTGVGKGTVKIFAALEIEPRCKGEITVTVEEAAKPTSIEITGITEGTAWVGDSAKLSTKVMPEDASSLVTWETSDDKVATIDSEGNLSFIKEGNVVISAISTADTNIKATLNFTVKYGTFTTSLSSGRFDIDTQADDVNPHVTLTAENSKGFNSLYFRHVKGTRYYAEAFFKVSGLTENTWAWQGVGLGSGLSDHDTRYFTFSPISPGQGNSFNKCIVRDYPTTWDALTNRSQIWGENGLNEIDCINNGVKVGLLRDGNIYYYLLNDRLFYVDETQKYDNVETYPILIAEDLPCVATNYYVTADSSVIEEKLNSKVFKQSFFPSNPNIVNYDSDASFTFDSPNVLSKDNKVRSIGDKAKVVRNFEIEFDMANLSFNNDHIASPTNPFTGMTFNFSRYDLADTVESMMIGRSGLQEDNTNIVARYASWNYQKSMDDPAAPSKYLESTKPVVNDGIAQNHVKITRTIDENNKSNFKMFVNNQEVEFDYKSTPTVLTQERYTGAYLIWIGGEYTSGSISNFVIRSNI